MSSRPVLTPKAAAKAHAQQAAGYRRAVRNLEKRRHANQKFPQVGAPGPGQIRLVGDEPPRVVTLLLAEAPSPDGGVGGWEEIPRDRRTPGIQHTGVPRATVSLNGILDDRALAQYAEGSIRDRVSKLYDLGRVDETTGEPARIMLLGDTPTYNPLWVIDGLQPGERLWTPTGQLRRQFLTIALSEWVDSSLAVTLPNAATRNSKGKAKTRYYTTRAHDTLRRVALTHLGTQSQWTTLLKLNRKVLTKVDPDALLRPGIKLKLGG